MIPIEKPLRLHTEINDDRFNVNRCQTPLGSRDNKLISIGEFNSSAYVGFLNFTFTRLTWPEIATTHHVIEWSSLIR
jgi:hypothetical protein